MIAEYTPRCPNKYNILSNRDLNPVTTVRLRRNPKGHRENA